MIEQFNRTIGESLAKLMSNENDTDWENYLDATLFAYRTMKHDTTKFTPFQLIYGRQAKLPLDLKIETFEENELSFEDQLYKRTQQILDKMENDQRQALDNIKKSQDQQIMRHNKRSTKLKIGDKVLLHRTDLMNNFSAKLQEKWLGPYYIHEVLPNNVYKLRTMEGKLIKGVTHGNRLKFYHQQELEPLVIIENE
jgi:hypothetical protein